MKLKFEYLVAIAMIAIALGGVGFGWQKSRLAAETRATAKQQENVPAATLNETEFDWGKIPREKLAVRDFTLSNAGGAALTVTRVATSCGCTTAELVQNGAPSVIPAEIPAGGSAVIHVVFDPAAHDSRGITKRAVRIETNDPENPFLIINLLADVQ